MRKESELREANVESSNNTVREVKRMDGVQ